MFNCRLILSLIEIGSNEWAARKSIIATGNWKQLPKIMIEKKWIAQEPRQEMTFLIVERPIFSSYDFGFWSIIEILSDDFPQGLAVGLFLRVVEYVLVVEDPSCCWQLPFCRTNAATFDQGGWKFLDIFYVSYQLSGQIWNISWNSLVVEKLGLKSATAFHSTIASVLLKKQ